MAPEQSLTMLQIRKLSLKVGDFRLRNIDLTIREGECHALLGPSGSGKSTLVSAMLGLKKPDQGHIYLGDKIIDHWTIERRGFGYLPQNLALFPHLTVEGNLRYGIRARKLEGPESEAHLQELIDTVEIRPLLKRMPETLSGGERQRVALVRALAPRPRLLLLDEPFSALDNTLRRELWSLVHRIRNDFGTTMLLITHDLAEAYFLSPQISIIIDGGIHQYGSREEVFFHPRSREVARYLGIRNIYEATVVEAQEGRTLFELPSLNCRLESKAALPPTAVGRKKILAIRPEHIELTENDKGVNTLCGKLDTFPMGNSTLGVFHPRASTSTVELLMHGNLLTRTEVCLHIPEERIIMLDEE